MKDPTSQGFGEDIQYSVPTTSSSLRGYFLERGYYLLESSKGLTEEDPKQRADLLCKMSQFLCFFHISLDSPEFIPLLNLGKYYGLVLCFYILLPLSGVTGYTITNQKHRRVRERITSQGNPITNPASAHLLSKLLTPSVPQFVHQQDVAVAIIPSISQGIVR